MSPTPSFELDAGVRRRHRGRLLVGGTPPRLVRLSEAGAAALNAVLAGEDAVPAVATMARRLERQGLIHPLPGDGSDDPEVTAIVPVLDGGEALGKLVRTLAAEGPVIVVDDGSGDGSAERAAAAGARVLRHGRPRGPAAARNAGLAAAGTEIVAFLDADCLVAPGWRRGLAGLLAADPSNALVAPRVRATPGASALARYERLAPPLDLGPHAGLVGPSRRVSYLPAAALLGRRDVLLDLGGFDETLRFGEDVDLVWRALAAGHRVRYAPSREVSHRPRPTLAGFAHQRAGYGSSAVELVKRHGRAAAPLRTGRHSALIWSAVALLGPRALLPALALSTAIVAGRGDDRASRLALAELALRGQTTAGAHLARVVAREWLPLGLAAAPFSRRARAALLTALAVDALPVWTGVDTPGELPRASALRLLDRSAYATGMWREMARRRDFRALRPRGLGPGPAETKEGAGSDPAPSFFRAPGDARA
ncbi:MAG: mycofactocin biosynthesis glycosyltransferase MftF [Actinobacteria bacterium]|nr:mycofactocin biosynthesis glycosyltransferase MftF [Actinomycetota bacterium]